MKKLLSVVMLCVLSLTMSVEALAWSERRNESFGVLVAAAQTKRKASAKKRKTQSSFKKYDETLGMAVAACDVDTVKKRVNAGADVNARDKWRWTTLMLASNNYSGPQVIEALLKAGANAKIKNSDDKRAIDYARQNSADKGLKGTKALKMLEEASR